jgi:hypothetical protein
MLPPPRSGRDAARRVAVRLCEQLAVTAVAEAAEHDVARAGPVDRLVVQPDVLQLQAAEPLERVCPPGAVIDRLAHRLAELAVADDVEADRTLLGDQLSDGLAQPRLERRLVGTLAGLTGTVQLDQVRRPREAARLGRQHAVTAVAHPHLLARSGEERSRPTLTRSLVGSGVGRDRGTGVPGSANPGAALHQPSPRRLPA